MRNPYGYDYVETRIAEQRFEAERRRHSNTRARRGAQDRIGSLLRLRSARHDDLGHGTD
jgi:hypothetical protein